MARWNFNWNPVWMDKSVDNDIVTAAGKGSIAAREDVSFTDSNFTVGNGNVSVADGNLRDSFNEDNSVSNSGNETITISYDNVGNTTNTLTENNSINGSYNDSSTNIEVEIEDSGNTYTDESTTTTTNTEWNIDDSFNIDDSGNTSNETNDFDYTSNVTENTTATEYNWEAELRNVFNDNIWSGGDTVVIDD